MKIAITGASGHIGFNLCGKLIESGNDLTILLRQLKPRLSDLEATVVSGNLTNEESLDALTAGAEVVIHLAAVISINSRKDSAALKRTNVVGTSNIVKACLRNNVRRLIHFSSVDAYNSFPLSETLDEKRGLKESRGNAYGTTKADAHQIALDAQKEGLEVIVLCPTGVLGPHDYAPSLAGKMILQYAWNQIPALVPGGFNWVDVRDVVKSTLTSISKGTSGESYLLPGHFVSNKKMAELICMETKSQPPKFTIPFWLAKLGAPFEAIRAAGAKTAPLYTKESIEIIETANRDISGEKATTQLSHAPRPVEETISDTVNWFRATGKLSG